MSITPQIRDELQQRLVDAIAKSFSPCPLIGPKWFRYVGGKNPSYQFVGTAKLAKATCGEPKRVAKALLTNLSLVGLSVAAQVDSNATIIITAKAAKVLAPSQPQAPAKPRPQVQKSGKPKPQPTQKPKPPLSQPQNSQPPQPPMPEPSLTAKAPEQSPEASPRPAAKPKKPRKESAAQTPPEPPAPKARKSLKFWQKKPKE